MIIIPTLIFVFIILASAALIMEETNTKPLLFLGKKFHAWAKQHNPKHITLQMYIAAASVYQSKKADEYREALKAQLQNYFTENNFSYVYIWGWSHIVVEIDSEHLTQTRRALRAFFTTWSDKITTTTCIGENLLVEYHGTKSTQDQSVIIKTSYPLHDLPPGILKPGCKVVHKTETTETYAIECDVQ